MSSTLLRRYIAIVEDAQVPKKGSIADLNTRWRQRAQPGEKDTRYRRGDTTVSVPASAASSVDTDAEGWEKIEDDD